MNATHNLTDNQVNIAMSFIDRASLDSRYKALPMSLRYQRLLEMVRANIADPMVANDIGMTDLHAITAYFLSKRAEMLIKGK